MAISTQKVFGTVELLENILVTALLRGMTQKQLVFAQRVSKTWKATIEGSPLLQKALFRRALSTKEDADFFAHWSAAVSDIHPEEREYTDYEGCQRYLYTSSLELPADPTGPTSKLYWPKNKHCFYEPSSIDRWNLLLCFPASCNLDTLIRWSSSRASVRSMLISQPPPTTLDFVRKSQPYGDRHCTVANPAGVTVGDLLDVLDSQDMALMKALNKTMEAGIYGGGESELLREVAMKSVVAGVSAGKALEMLEANGWEKEEEEWSLW